MGYSSETYRKVGALLEERRRRARHEALLRKAAVYEKIPRLRELEQALSQNAVVLSMTALREQEHADEALQALRAENASIQEERKALLLKNGFAEDELEPKYTCPNCKDTGRVNGVLCSCYKDACRETARQELEQNSGAAKCSFENFRLELYPAEPNERGMVPRDKMAVNARYCKDYAEKFSESSPSLFMVGRTGLGKTHLSLAIARVAVEKGYGVVYQTAQRLVNELEREHFSGSGSDAAQKKYAECDLLIIDDLGAEFSTTFSVAALGNLISERLFENRPTIISSNLGADELTNRYTERIGSRLLGEYKILYFLGNDLRTRKY